MPPPHPKRSLPSHWSDLYQMAAIAARESGKCLHLTPIHLKSGSFGPDTINLPFNSFPPETGTTLSPKLLSKKPA